MKYFFSILLLILLQKVNSQISDSIRLKDLVITDNYLIQSEKFQNIIQLSDSIIHQNTTSLTDVLNRNTPIFFKQNGYGMVSSPSFRGTTAQQTSVLWNGLNINSLFLGQTDFNTINATDYEQIIIKPGGGSIVYGSGAVGGAIYLNNTLKFKPEDKNTLGFSAGSFGRYAMNYKWRKSTKKYSIRLGLGREQSVNDFEIPKIKYKNLNGEFYNDTYSLDLGYKINPQQKILFYNQYYTDLRHFSLIEPTANKTKYTNENIRNLIHWQFKNPQNLLNAKAGFLYEKYRYFQDINSENYSGGRVATFVLKTDYQRNLPYDFKLFLLGEAKKSYAKGINSGIKNPKRLAGSFSVLISQQALANLSYQVGVRKEFTTDFKSPLLYSLGVNYEYLKNQILKINYSKNFRAPSFNDLFWQPGGNLHLKAETAEELELSHQLKLKNIGFNISVFYNKISDMIAWQPTGKGYWAPTNTHKVSTKGIEVYFNANLYKSENIGVSLLLNYAFTYAKNLENNQLLAYVPKNKINTTLNFIDGKCNLFVQHSFVDSFRTLISNKHKIKFHNTFNLGGEYSFGQENKFHIGFVINNLMGKIYQSMPYRYMPPRNFLLRFKMAM